jgi:hypothetical protein
MFKKTLLAAALATTTLGAVASTVSTTPATVGVEYAVGIKQITAANVDVDTGRDFNNGDIIVVTYTGTTVATMTAAATPAAIVPSVSGGAVEFLEFEGNTVKLLVTDDVASGSTITVSGIQLVVTDAAAKGTVKVSALGKVATVEGSKTVDASKAVTYITYAQQLNTKVGTAFDGVVDVNAMRKKFDDKTTSDTLVIENTESAVSSTFGVTTTGVTYTVFGDFGFLDVDGDGTLEAKEGTISTTGGTVALSKDFMSAVVTQDSAFASGTVGVTVTGAAGSVIPDQSYMAKTDVAYTNPAGGATELVANTLVKSSAGSWTLNGAKAHIPFLPFGSNFAQSVTVSNTSAQTGGVDLIIYVGSDTVEVDSIATVVGQGVTDISAAIRSAVDAAGLSSATLSFDVIINAPDTAITVEALYYAKSDGDRLRTL